MPSILRAVALAAALLVVVAALFYGGFFLMLAAGDQSTYHSDSTVVDDADFDAVLENARAAGYAVEVRDGNGVHPEDVTALERELGPDYRVFRTVFCYDEHTRMEVLFGAADEANGGVIVEFFDDDYPGPFTVHQLPPDAWIRDRLTLLFEMDDATAAAYVVELRDRIRNDNDGVPSVEVDEAPNLGAVHENFTSQATTVSEKGPTGSGWYERRYVVDNRTVGGFDFVVAAAVVGHREGRRTYEIHVDRLGGLQLVSEGPAGQELPDDDLREVFRGMLRDLGLPPGAVDRVTFEYRSSVW